MTQNRSVPAAPSVSAASSASPWPGLSRKDGFFEDDDIRALLARTKEYVEAGLCLNLTGAAGLGKTALALRIAEEIGRPISFMTGNQWLTTRDFVGREVGEVQRQVVDKYVQSVRRTETERRSDWRAAILAVSMARGYTLVYDEFTRASPEANAALLSVMEEGVLVSTDRASDQSYIEAHENFRIILTSNPHDYAGVKAAPDALLDRMVTIALPPPRVEQMAGVVAARTGLDLHTATQIARIVHGAQPLTEATVPAGSALRSAVLMGRVAAHQIRSGRFATPNLVTLATDILGGRGQRVDPAHLHACLTSEPQCQRTRAP